MPAKCCCVSADLMNCKHFPAMFPEPGYLYRTHLALYGTTIYLCGAQAIIDITFIASHQTSLWLIRHSLAVDLAR